MDATNKKLFDFSLLPKANAFIQTDARNPAYIGGLGNAKTTALCIKGIKASMDYPGNTGMICRATNKQLEDSTMKVFFELFNCTADTARGHPQFAYWSQSTKTLRFKNGSVVMFRYLEGEQAIENLRSTEINWAGIDQAEEVSRTAWEELDSRCRKDAHIPPWCAIIANPAGHNWFWRMHFREFADDPDFPIWVATTMENPHLPDHYIPGLLKKHSEDWVKRFVYGSFDVFAGMVFEEWNEGIHVIEPFEIPDEWKIGYGADFGIRNDTVFMGAARDWDGNLIWYDEIRDHEKLPRHFCEILKPRLHSEHLNMDLPIWGDPSMMATAIGTGKNLQAEYFRQGVLIYPGNKKKRIVRINRLKDFLKIDWDMQHPYKPGVKGASQMYFMKNCEGTIEEYPGYQWKQLKPGEEEKKSPEEDVVKVNDHGIDATGYFVLSHVVFNTPAKEEVDDDLQILREEQKMFRQEAEKDSYSY